MTQTLPFIIPYEQQADATNARMCGAACLSMVYRSFEKEIPQAQLWPAIAKRNEFGSIAASTHLMARDALKRGFDAVAVQTSEPIQALKNCRETGIRAILNHLLEPRKPVGHYSVLFDVDDEYVYLHDPFFGPARRMRHDDLLEIWKPQEQQSEISGYVLIGVSARGTGTAPKTECPACHSALAMPPAALLARANICPECDHVFAFDGNAEPAAKKADLSQVLGALDRFSSVLMSIPGIAEHREVLQQLNALAQQKEKMQAAAKAFEESQKVAKQQMATMRESANAAKEAHDKKIAALNVPMEQLDGHALGLALLKSLGMSTDKETS